MPRLSTRVRAGVAGAALLAGGAGFASCSGEQTEPLGGAGPAASSTVTGTGASFCDEVVRHRDEYWTVAKSLTSVQGVKNLLSGRTDVSALGPMWKDLAAAAPGRITDETTLVATRWTTMLEAYENRQWVKLARTVGSMTGPMADVNRFVRLTCGKKYGPAG